MEYNSEIKHKWTTDTCYMEKHQNIVLEARSKTTGCMIPFTSNDKKKQEQDQGVFFRYWNYSMLHLHLNCVDGCKTP